MAIHTYDETMQKIKDEGWDLTDEDIALAKIDPDAVWGIMTAKTNYGKSTTNEERQYWNDYANTIRSNTGGYSAGKDGSQFILNAEQTPGSFNFGEYQNPYDDQINAALDKLTNREPFQSKNEGQINEILSGNYDVSTNPVYQSYVKSNAREARRSAQDAMGSSAALTGGMASSAATTAAAQASNYYNSQTADAVPGIIADTLTNLQNMDNTDYQRYIDQIGLSRDDISTLQSLAADDRDQWNTELEREYQQLLDSLTYKADRADQAANIDLQKKAIEMDGKEMDINALIAYANQTEDSSPLRKLLQALGLM